MKKSREILVRIVLDNSKCSLHGICESIAPNIFGLAEDGTRQILLDELDETQLPLAKEAVEACPTMALQLVPSDQCCAT
ncbi:ferredoxin [Mycobacterium intracellulare]|uniref:ferredoxin n=1 Tax=Mycobacterium intracellulare TaxID=1767 RepID=UPI003316370F